MKKVLIVVGVFWALVLLFAVIMPFFNKKTDTAATQATEPTPIAAVIPNVETKAVEGDGIVQQGQPVLDNVPSAKDNTKTVTDTAKPKQTQSSDPGEILVN